MKKTVAITADVIMAIVCVIAMASLLSKQNYWCELLSHFRLLFIAVLAMILVAQSVMRRKTALVTLSILAVLAAPVINLCTKDSAPDRKDVAKVRILEMNLWGGKNHDYDRAIAAIESADADVVGLSEITDAWLNELRQRLPQYHHVVAEPQHGGIAVFSRLPMTGKVDYYGTIKRPRIEATIQLENQDITLIFAHPVIPIRMAELRNGELDVLAEEAKDRKHPLILAGDLNCTPWSYYFDNLLSVGNLRDTEKGFGPQPSWCAFYIPIFPIDHCLVTPDFITFSRRLLPRFGSDHLPVVVDLGLYYNRSN